MPIAIGGEYFDDEVSYTAKLLGIELPSEVPSQGTQKATDASNSPAGIKVPGNIDLHHRPVVQNGKDISTVLSKSFGFDEGEVLIPTVAADGSGILSDDDAIAQYRKTGQHLGIFDTSDNASTYAQSLHEDQAKEYLPKERYQTWPERMARSAISAMALPGDVLSGKVQPGSPQEIERAMDLAGLMVGGPAPVASKLAEGTLGSFAGVTAKGIDKNRLAQAQLLDAKNVHPDTIWEKTGFFRGADDRWRYEIPDKEAKLSDKGFNRVIDEDMSGELVPFVSVRKEGTTLGEALDHPELFKAYPHLKDTKILPLPKSIADKGTIGQMSEDTMYLKDDLHPDFARSVILHELQHSIQRKEGFARGGNVQEFEHPGLSKAKKIYEDALSAGADPKSEPLIKAKQILDEEKDKAHVLYTRLMGEAEARNVQTRMDFDEVMRKQTPRSTEDVPRFLQEKR